MKKVMTAVILAMCLFNGAMAMDFNQVIVAIFGGGNPDRQVHGPNRSQSSGPCSPHWNAAQASALTSTATSAAMRSAVAMAATITGTTDAGSVRGRAPATHLFTALRPAWELREVGLSLLDVFELVDTPEHRAGADAPGPPGAATAQCPGIAARDLERGDVVAARKRGGGAVRRRRQRPVITRCRRSFSGC